MSVKRTIFPLLLIKITIFNTFASQNHVLHTNNSKNLIFSTPVQVKIAIFCTFASKIQLYLWFWPENFIFSYFPDQKTWIFKIFWSPLHPGVILDLPGVILSHPRVILGHPFHAGVTLVSDWPGSYSRLSQGHEIKWEWGRKNQSRYLSVRELVSQGIRIEDLELLQSWS